jgi:hypothetical protein
MEKGGDRGPRITGIGDEDHQMLRGPAVKFYGMGRLGRGKRER